MNQYLIKAVFFLTTMLVACSAAAQDTTKVFGTVKDAATGTSLPFVDVYLVEKGVGITSDVDGNYTITTTAAIDSIGFAYLGYVQKNIRIRQGQTQEINVLLTESSVDLQVATVTAKRGRREKDTAAIALWRKVVRHRSTNSIDNADAYQYENYIQTGFDWYNPSKKFFIFQILKKPLRVVDDYIRQEETGDSYLPVLMKETIKEVKYQKSPKEKKTRVIADRFSGIENESLSDFIGNELNEIDPYKEMIVLAGKSFVSPFASTANINYNYFITDSLERDGDKYYLLTFVGKRKRDYTFLGGAWIHKPTSAIESIELEISPHIALNFVKRLNTTQYYSPTPEGVWIKTSEELDAKVAIDLFDFGSRKNKKRKNLIRIRKKLSRNKIKINPTFTKKELAVEDMVYADSSADWSENVWDTLRPTPLDTIGAGVYEMIDSIQRTFFYKSMDWMVYMFITSHLRAGPVEFGKYPEFVSWNDIEGVRLKLGVRTTKKLSEKFQLHGFAAYGIKDKEWKYGTGFKAHLPSKNRKWHMLSAWYKYDFKMMAQRKNTLKHDNIINSITRTTPLDRLMKIRESGITYHRDWFMGFYSKVGYRWRRFYSVDGGFKFTQNNGEDFIPSFTTSEIKVELHWGHKERFWTENSGFERASMGTEFPILDFAYTAGIKGFLGGDHTYHKFDLSVRQRLSSLIGYTKYQLKASRVFGQVPYPVMNVHLGNESILANRFAYALMDEFEFVSDTYVALRFTHHFDGWILNTIPLINKLKWRTLIIFNGLYGSVADQNRNLYDFDEGIEAPNFYAEVGFGIENIFKVIRIDFLWRLTHLHKPSVRQFGINISFAPKF